MRNPISLTIVLMALWGQAFAQGPGTPIKFSGQIRFRSEADGRDFDNDTDINNFTLLRSRFGAAIQPATDVEVFFQVQDSRTFGQEPNTLASTGNVDVHQAFFRVRNLWGKPIDLQAGRQELIYGNERLIGAVGWHNVGRSFDGVKITFGRQSTLDLIAVTLNESNVVDNDARFTGLYYKHRKKSDYILDIYGLYESDPTETIPGEDDLARVTLGSYNKGKLSQKVDFETEVALQLGKRLGRDVSAYMLTGSLVYTLPYSRRPSVRIGYDYLSGMDANDEDYKAFDTLFATNHKFYGIMDYFVNIPASTNNRGLQDLMIKGTFPINNKLILNTHLHNFRAAKGDRKNFGNELDLMLNYQYNTVVSCVVGLAFFTPGDLFEQSFGSNDFGVWSYTSCTVSF